MKTLTKIALALGILGSTVAAQAGWMSGYYRSNGTYVAPYYRSDYGSIGRSASFGYVYRNPYAAEPTVNVHGYFRSNGAYVAPHVRTAPNDTVTDNLSYRGFGTIRVPKSSLGEDFGLPSSSFSVPRPLPAFDGDFAVRPLGE